jgi:hypothetical protein
MLRIAIHIQLSNSKLPARPHPRGAIAPEPCVSVSPSDKQRAQGKPGAGWHPRSRVQMRKEKTHTSIQVRGLDRPNHLDPVRKISFFAQGV